MYPLVWIVMLFIHPLQVLRQPVRTMYWLWWAEEERNYPKHLVKAVARWNRGKQQWDTKWQFKLRPRNES